MKKSYKLKRFVRFLFITWTIAIVGCGGLLFYLEKTKDLEIVELGSIYFNLWWLIPLLISYIVIFIIYSKLKITLTNDFIIWPYPLKNINGKRLRYDKIKRVNIKEKKGKSYLHSIRDDKNNHYKISYFTGKDNGQEIKRFLQKINRKKPHDIPFKKIE